MDMLNSGTNSFLTVIEEVSVIVKIQQMTCNCIQTINTVHLFAL